MKNYLHPGVIIIGNYSNLNYKLNKTVIFNHQYIN